MRKMSTAARPTGHRASMKVRGLHASEEDSDSRRIRGRHGLPPQTRDARPAQGRDPATRGRKGQPTHLLALTEYIDRMLEQSDVDEKELAGRIEGHFVPFDEMDDDEGTVKQRY